MVSRLIMGITGVIIWLIGTIHLLTKSPELPNSQALGFRAYLREIGGVVVGILQGNV